MFNTAKVKLNEQPKEKKCAKGVSRSFSGGVDLCGLCSIDLILFIRSKIVTLHNCNYYMCIFSFLNDRRNKQLCLHILDIYNGRYLVYILTKTTGIIDRGRENIEAV